MMMSRRALLKAAGLTAGSATLSSLGGALPAFQAHAANTAGYKAMVCLFLLGGLDQNDMVFPYDTASYDAFAELRAPLLGAYSGPESRARGNLLPLAPDNAADLGGREYALAPELSGLHGLFQSGRAALVANVGPLLEPVTREAIFQETARLPAGLFSHNDQQSHWVSGQPEGAPSGWGGRMADQVLAAAPGQTRDFTTLSTLGNEVFLTGNTVQPYLVGLDGAPSVDLIDVFEGNPFAQEGNISYEALRDHFEQTTHARRNLIERDMSAAISGALSKNEAFNAALMASQPLTTQFPPDNFLAAQLRAIARTISVRDSLLMQRQVFFAAIGGFDTHSNQAADLPRLLLQIDQAVTAFVSAMEELGLSNDVCVFTASDFGRTLAINGDGTDHGWGAHHFVIGGGVRGGRILGEMPPYVLDHDLDVGSGRLVPTLSVEQFASPLGRWFGLNEAELAASLPALGAFDSNALSLF